MHTIQTGLWTHTHSFSSDDNILANCVTNPRWWRRCIHSRDCLMYRFQRRSPALNGWIKWDTGDGESDFSEQMTGCLDIQTHTHAHKTWLMTIGQQHCHWMGKKLFLHGFRFYQWIHSIRCAHPVQSSRIRIAQAWKRLSKWSYQPSAVGSCKTFSIFSKEVTSLPISLSLSPARLCVYVCVPSSFLSFGSNFFHFRWQSKPVCHRHENRATMMRTRLTFSPFHNQLEHNLTTD